jgi:CRP-like cAMP-binding protein
MPNSAAVLPRLVPCERCPLRPLRVFRDFSAEELAFVGEFKSGELTAQPGTTLFMQGTNSAHLYTLLSGIAFRYKMLPDGRRQILNFAFPGEFLGLQGSIANEMQHSIEVLTDSVLCVFPRDKFWDLYSLRHHLARSARRAVPRRAPAQHRPALRARALGVHSSTPLSSG